jgi:hypothetical protein
MADSSMDVLARLREELNQAHPDQLRAMLQVMVEQLMGAEVDALCGPSTVSGAQSGRTPAGVGPRAYGPPTCCNVRWPPPVCHW